MDNYESTRRGFLQKLGLSVGAVVLSSGVKATQILEKSGDFPLSDEQSNFLEEYEEWMSHFVEVIKERRTRPDDLEVNMRLMRLSEKAEGWQKNLKKHMEDQNFASHYMIVTERMTNEID